MMIDAILASSHSPWPRLHSWGSPDDNDDDDNIDDDYSDNIDDYDDDDFDDDDFDDDHDDNDDVHSPWPRPHSSDSPSCPSLP